MPKDVKLHFKPEKKEKDQKKDQKKRKKKTQLAPKDKTNVDALHAYTQKELDLHTWDAAKFASSVSRPGGQVPPLSQMSAPLYPQATTAISFQQLQHRLSSPTKAMTSPLVSSNLSQEVSMLSASTMSSVHDSSFEGDRFVVSAGDGPEVSLVYLYFIFLEFFINCFSTLHFWPRFIPECRWLIFMYFGNSNRYWCIDFNMRGLEAFSNNQGGHDTGKTGNLAVNFSRQGKHREFSKFNFLHRENCANTGKILKI